MSWGNFLLNSSAKGSANLPLPQTAAARAAVDWVCLLLSSDSACLHHLVTLAEPS